MYNIYTPKEILVIIIVLLKIDLNIHRIHFLCESHNL